jgi:hypothetical protein
VVSISMQVSSDSTFSHSFRWFCTVTSMYVFVSIQLIR